MVLLIDFIIVFIGIAAVVLSADYAINGSIAIARRFKLSDTFIGMTILAIGTSLPEIMTAVIASIKILINPVHMDVLSGLVLGTNLGSDIFQQNFVLSVVAILGVIIVHKRQLIEDMGGLLGATALLFLFTLNGFLSRIEGAILVGGYLCYLYFLKKEEQNNNKEKKSITNKLTKNMIVVLASFIIMAVSAHFVINYSEKIVESLNISASFFGVIILGVAAALPELTTAMLAVKKHRSAISAGVLIGSNITNPMLALGLGALISGYNVAKVVTFFDLPVKFITALILSGLLWKNEKLKKNYAVIMILVYLAYLTIRRVYFPVDF
ncbi:sodium:calcium antiporter [Nanoarchaeota archaeon]